MGRRQAGGHSSQAVEGHVPTHRADRRSGGRGRLHPQRLRRRQEDVVDGHHDGRGRGDAGRRRLRLAAEAEVRPGQPRHDEPVLRADEVRRRGRVQAAGLQLPVDGLAEQQRQRDGQRVQQRDHGQGERHRGVPRRPQGVQRPDRQGAGGEDPGRRLQRRRRRQQPAGLHRPGPLRLGPADGRAHRGARPVRRRGALHRHAGLAEHPAAHRRRPGHHQEEGQGDHAARDRHRRRRSRRSSRRSTPTGRATRTRRACSPWTPAAPRTWPR